MINIIPKYKDHKITAERKPAKKEELKEILTKIGKIEIKEKEAKEEKKETKDEVKKEEKKEEIQKSNVIKLPRRIP
jgi:hypothetical protein